MTTRKDVKPVPLPARLPGFCACGSNGRLATSPALHGPLAFLSAGKGRMPGCELVQLGQLLG